MPADAGNIAEDAGDAGLPLEPPRSRVRVTNTQAMVGWLAARLNLFSIDPAYSVLLDPQLTKFCLRKSKKVSLNQVYWVCVT